MQWKPQINLGIAKSHQAAGQLVGMQLAAANLLALIVSAGSVVAGSTLLALQQFPTAWPLWVAAGGIGVGLALLIEGLTLSALIRVRIAGREIRASEARVCEKRDKRLAQVALPDPAHPHYQLLKKRYQEARKLVEREARLAIREQTHRARRDRRNSLALAAGGCIASMCAGGLFYHALLAGLGQLTSVVLSAIFTLAVSGTFISSEVFKDLQEQAIREAFSNGQLAEFAMRQETRVRSLWAVHEQIGAYLQSQEAQQIIAEGGKLLVTAILKELHQDLRHNPASGLSVPLALSEEQKPREHTGVLAQATAGLFADEGNQQTSQPFSASSDGARNAIRGPAMGYPNQQEPDHVLANLVTLKAGEQATVHLAAEEQKALLIPIQQPVFANGPVDDPDFPSSLEEGNVAHMVVHADQEELSGSALASSDAEVIQPALVDPHSRFPLLQSPAHLHASQSPKESVTEDHVRVLRAVKRASDNRKQSLKGLDHRARIRAVMAQARHQGLTPTYHDIARAAGVGYSTVKKHARAIRAELQEQHVL